MINSKGDEFGISPFRSTFDTLFIGTVLPGDININDVIGYLRHIARKRLIALVKFPKFEVIPGMEFRYFESTNMHEKCWNWCTKAKRVGQDDFESQMNVISRFHKPLDVTLTFTLLNPGETPVEINLFLNEIQLPVRCIEGKNTLEFTVFPGANILRFIQSYKEFSNHLVSERISFGVMNFQISSPGYLATTCICELRSEYMLRKTFHRSGYENITLARWECRKSSALNLEGEPSDYWRLHESPRRSQRIQLLIASSC
jgi:hypothetical protein